MHLYMALISPFISSPGTPSMDFLSIRESTAWRGGYPTFLSHRQCNSSFLGLLAGTSTSGGFLEV